MPSDAAIKRRGLHSSRIGWAALLVACVFPAAADLFDGDQPLKLQLSAPFGAVIRARADPEYHEAQLRLGNADDAITVPLRIRVRGRSRAVACTFPPLLLNFRTADLAGTMFAGEDRLKLVTHCNSGSDYDQYLRLEYLTYRVLNLLSPASLRARLVEVSYFDTARERDLGTRPGILLEDEERFAERQGWTKFAGDKVDRAKYDASALSLLDVFEYFIGNTDWSALSGPAGGECCHNVVPYVRNDGVFVPVAYDFDSAGLVNPPHAVPAAQLPIRNVRQRLYRGRCRPQTELEPIFAAFTERRSAITALFNEQEGLGAAAAESARAYVELFYDTLGDEQRRQAAFFDDCAR